MGFPILQAEIMRGEKRSEPDYDLRLYNPATGKCDLSEEEARKKESQNRAESEAADRQRQQRLERWRNTPLEPEAKEALGNVSPELAWLQVQDQVGGEFQHGWSGDSVRHGKLPGSYGKRECR
jgi:hypothetical protein